MRIGHGYAPGTKPPTPAAVLLRTAFTPQRIVVRTAVGKKVASPGGGSFCRQPHCDGGFNYITHCSERPGDLVRTCISIGRYDCAACRAQFEGSHFLFLLRDEGGEPLSGLQVSLRRG